MTFSSFLIPIEGKNYPANEIIYYPDTLTGKPVQDPLRAGDGRDAFRPGYKTVFSPYTNPDSQDKYRRPTGFAFEIKDVKDGVYHLNIYMHTYPEEGRSKKVKGKKGKD